MKRARPAARRLDEARAVAIFERAFAEPRSRRILRGIGDDAAVLLAPETPLVVTVDASVEDTHFRRAFAALTDIGFRAFQAAASDLAAMGARPLAAVSALTLPRDFTAADLRLLARGQAAAAKSVDCPLVGGNVARAELLSLTTTVLGTAERPLARDGARPGDECWLVGDVGLAAAGLALLQRKKRALGLPERRCLTAWRRPRALIERGLALATRAHAAIDISDGLAGDATRVAEASRCRLVLEERAVRRAFAPELIAVAHRLGRDPLEFALYGGEDYALVCAGTAERRPRWAHSIGRFERGSGGYLEREDGRRVPLRGGFDHFRT
jgi:thiamine-monophosphate kinase